MKNEDTLLKTDGLWGLWMTPAYSFIVRNPKGENVALYKKGNRNGANRGLKYHASK